MPFSCQLFLALGVYIERILHYITLLDRCLVSHKTWT